ncbi:hypothetical protein GQ457_14G020360 [Hibiscus cannabinus]
MATNDLNELRNQLQELLDHGIIRLIICLWGALLLFILNNDVAMRMCLDYRQSNKLSIKISTEVYLNNQTDQNFSTYDKKDWYGSGNQPLNVPALQTRYFQHLADSNVGSSEGGTVFVVKQDIKLVVVWRNMRDESNKVYIDITTDTTINWNFYKTQLATSSSHAESTNLGYKATVDIDPNSVTPNLNAKLEQA